MNVLSIEYNLSEYEYNLSENFGNLMHLNCPLFLADTFLSARYNFNQGGDSPDRYRNLVCESRQYDRTRENGRCYSSAWVHPRTRDCYLNPYSDYDTKKMNSSLSCSSIETLLLYFVE